MYKKTFIFYKVFFYLTNILILEKQENKKEKYKDNYF